MAKTSYLTIEPELEEKYYQGLQNMDRFIIPRIKAKTALLSRNKKKEIADRSYLKQCRNLWNNLTDEEKQNWKSIDSHSQQHGFRTFVADQCQRIKLGLSGTATPNQYHQNMVGKLLVESPSEEIKLKQAHPSSYWIAQKVEGKKNMYEPIEINESFTLPLKITISHFSDLVSTGEGSFIHFYAAIRHLYQGQNLNYNLIINIPLQSHWWTKEITISSLIGQAISYDLYIHLYKVRGSLYIDNIKSEHSGNNWTRDSFCEKIEETYDRGFFQVLPHWSIITLPTGSSFKSVYFEDEEYTASLYGLKWYGINLYGEEE